MNVHPLTPFALLFFGFSLVTQLIGYAVAALKGVWFSTLVVAALVTGWGAFPLTISRCNDMGCGMAILIGGVLLSVAVASGLMVTATACSGRLFRRFLHRDAR